MATTARFNRKVAPKAPTKSAPIKASFFSRAKTVVVQATNHVITFVKVQARKVAAVVRSVVARVKPVVKRAWALALRPFLGGVLAGTSLGVVIVGVLVAPATTVVALLVGGLAFIGLARGVRVLEESTSRVAAVTLQILEIVAQALRAAAYAGAAVLAVAMAVSSWPFAVFSVLLLVLAYLDVRGAGTIAFIAWCVLSGSWGFGLLWLMWHGASRFAYAPAEVVDVPEYSEIRRRPTVEHAHVLHATVGAEEVADLVESESWDRAYENEQACDACGTTKGAARIRSNAVPFTTAGPNIGQPHAASDAMLCSDCYDAECEDNAIALTGVSLRKRSVNVVLNAAGRASLLESVASLADTTQVFWATTAWWRDRKGHHHERQWDCFHAGKVVATVTYDHARKVYRASAAGKFLGTKTGLGVAKRLAVDTFNDSLDVTDLRRGALREQIAWSKGEAS